jgi:hypothetical protein
VRRKQMARKKYEALNVIDYISTRTGVYAHVEPGDVFDDMDSLALSSELEHGNIRQVEGGEGE